MFSFLLFLPASLQLSVRQTCTSSHIWLEPSDDKMDLLPLDKQTCVSTYRNQTVLDRYCLGPKETIPIALTPKGLWADLSHNIIVNCPLISAYELMFPVSTSITVNSSGVLEVAIEEQQKLILSARLVVTDCFLFSTERGKIGEKKVQILDQVGCPVEERISTLEEEQIGQRRLLRGQLSPSIFSHFPSQLQCSVTPCGQECVLPCDERDKLQTISASSRILLSTFLPSTVEVSALTIENCGWWLQRLLLIGLFCLLLLTTLFSLYMIYKNCPWTVDEILEIVHIKKNPRRGHLHIIHPIDHFDSPPIITKRSPLQSATGSTSSSSFSSSGEGPIWKKNQTCTNSNIKKFDDYITAHFMESLPEPPKVPVSQLADFLGNKEKKPVVEYASICRTSTKTPTPLKRTVSKNSSSSNHQDSSSPLTSANLQKHDDIQKMITKTFKTFSLDSMKTGQSVFTASLPERTRDESRFIIK